MTETTGAYEPIKHATEFLDTDFFSICCLTQAGSREGKSGNQDAYKVRDLPDGSLVVAVADGVGDNKCPYSATGAKKAVNVATDYFIKNFLPVHKNFLAEKKSDRQRLLSAKKIIAEISRWWKTGLPAGSEPIEYAATLMIGIADPDHLAIIRLGDSAVYCSDNKDNISVILGNDKYRNSVTTLAHENPHAHIDWKFLPNQAGKALLFATDGIYDFVDNESGNLPPSIITDITNSSFKRIRPTPDDLTAVLVRRK